MKKYFREGVTIRAKDGNDEPYNLVSDADVESEHAIAERIRSSFPDHDVMGEEEHQADAATLKGTIDGPTSQSFPLPVAANLLCCDLLAMRCRQAEHHARHRR